MILDDATHIFAGRFANFCVLGNLPDFAQCEAEILGLADKTQALCIAGLELTVAIALLATRFDQADTRVVAHHMGGSAAFLCEFVDGKHGFSPRFYCNDAILQPVCYAQVNSFFFDCFCRGVFDRLWQVGLQ